MLTINDGGSLWRALSTSTDPQLRLLLIKRRDQLGGDIKDLARFIIPEPGDSLADLEKELGFAIQADSETSFSFEWFEDHAGIIELVWILTDDGFAHVVLLNKAAGIDPDLLSLCTVQA